MAQRQYVGRLGSRYHLPRAREYIIPSFLLIHKTEAGDTWHLAVAPRGGIRPVTGQNAPNVCQSSSFSICLKASKSSRQSASSSSTDWLLESVSSSGFSESLSCWGWATAGSASAGLTSSFGALTSSAGLVSSSTGLTSSGALSSSSTVLICDWPIGSCEVGVVASVKQSSSLSCTSAPEKEAGAWDETALHTNTPPLPPLQSIDASW